MEYDKGNVLNSATIEKELEIQSTLLDCVRTLSEIEDTRLAIDSFLKILAGYYQADRAYIFEFSNDNQKMDNTYEWCKEGVVPAIDILQNLDIHLIDLWMDKFMQGGAFYLSSLEHQYAKDSDEYRMLQEQNIESLIAAPLMKNKDIVGFVGVDNPTINIDSKVLIVSITSFIYNDIRRRKNMEMLRKLSYFDSLTNAYNRNAYFDELEKLEKESEGTLGIVYVDVNGLKRVNDTLGHKAGDRLIVSVADKLFQYLPGGEVYRTGGDEFIVFCKNISETEFQIMIDNLQSSWNEESSAAAGDIWIDKIEQVESKVSAAEKKMYVGKRKFYERRGMNRRGDARR